MSQPIPDFPSCLTRAQNDTPPEPRYTLSMALGEFNRTIHKVVLSDQNRSLNKSLKDAETDLKNLNQILESNQQAQQILIEKIDKVKNNLFQKQDTIQRLDKHFEESTINDSYNICLHFLRNSIETDLKNLNDILGNDQQLLEILIENTDRIKNQVLEKQETIQKTNEEINQSQPCIDSQRAIIEMEIDSPTSPTQQIVHKRPSSEVIDLSSNGLFHKRQKTVLEKESDDSFDMDIDSSLEESEVVEPSSGKKEESGETPASLLYTPQAVVKEHSEEISAILKSRSAHYMSEEIFSKKFSKTYFQDKQHYLEVMQNSKLPHNLALKEVPPLGKGVFLEPDAPAISKGSFIGYYAGKFVFNDNDSSNSTYSYGLIDEIPSRKDSTLDIDAKELGNFTRFFNHSNRPNVETHAIRDEDGFIQCAVIAIKKISPGEQLMLNYGNKYWTAQGIKPTYATPESHVLTMDGTVVKKSK